MTGDEIAEEPDAVYGQEGEGNKRQQNRRPVRSKEAFERLHFSVEFS
jgi:hypothetical protein